MLFLYPGRLIAVLWLLYCVLIPIANQSLPSVRRFLEFSGLPIPPLYVGVLFLTAYLLQKGITLLGDSSDRYRHAFGETQEMMYAAIFLILAFYFATKVSRQLTWLYDRPRVTVG